MPFTKNENNKILDMYLRGEAITPPESLYLGLFTADTGLADNDLTVAQEIEYGNYSRVKVRDAVTQTTSAAVNGESVNETAYVFPVATSPGGTPTHAVLLDASTDGNVIAFGALAMIGGSRPLEAGLGFALDLNQVKWSMS
ncbi:hypothetical protein [Maridesulfovibrio sp.]|uniref:phage tail fiber protein n=1 Tax=Maridesulfovibrio sp. TaxID=2795000 RepID=UPI0029C9CB88|nr:hypothetical protein [Maridesulfovibrio sp.]